MSDLTCEATDDSYLVANASGGVGELTCTWTLEASNNTWQLVSGIDDPIIYFKPGKLEATITVVVTDETGAQISSSMDLTSRCRGRGRNFWNNINYGNLNTLFRGSSFVQLYPNPVKDKLNIKLYKSLVNSSVRIEIFDLVGIRAFNKSYKNFDGKNIAIDFSRFESNIYYVKIITKNGTEIKKVILNK
jgi:hypothetical protein